MKKLLVFFITFFVILPLPFTTISCSFEQKNNTKNLINWFSNTYPNSKVESVSLDQKYDNLYMFSGFSIDLVEYQFYYDRTSSYPKDYVIYSSQNHKFYDYNNLTDNIYGLIAWVYTLKNDITQSLVNYTNLNYHITDARVEPVDNIQTQATDFNLHINYIDNDTGKSGEHVYYAKWIQNTSIPTFNLLNNKQTNNN